MSPQKAQFERFRGLALEVAKMSPQKAQFEHFGSFEYFWSLALEHRSSKVFENIGVTKFSKVGNFGPPALSLLCVKAGLPFSTFAQRLRAQARRYIYIYIYIPPDSYPLEGGLHKKTYYW